MEQNCSITIKTTLKSCLSQITLCKKNYIYLNLHKIFYKTLNQNGPLTITILIALLFILFLNIKIISEKYLAKVNLNLIKKFKIPDYIAVISLVPFTNGALDLINSFESSKKENGHILCISVLLGSFMVSSTLVFFNVIFQSKEEVFYLGDDFYLNLVFYALALFLVAVFGIRKKLDFFCFFSIFFLYLSYVFVNFWKKNKKSDENDIFGDDYLKNKKNNNLNTSDDNIESLETTFSEKTKNLEKINLLNKKEKKFEIILEEEELLLKKIKILQYKVPRKKINLKKYLLPLKIIHWLTIPYLKIENQKSLPNFIKIYHDFFNTTFSSFLTFTILFKFSYHISLILTLLIINLIFFFEKSKKIKYFIFFTRSLTILSSLSWLKITSGLVLDIITFFSFYYNLNYIILSTTFISLGNTSLDFFSNGSLSKFGNYKIAILSCFSSPFFNLVFGFCFFFFFGKNLNFNLFGFFENEKKIGQVFLRWVFAFCFFSLVIQFWIFKNNNMVVRKKNRFYYIGIYAGFFGLSWLLF